MLLRLLLFSVTGLLCSCNPNQQKVTLGNPAKRALKTTELASDSKKRLDLLASQTGLTNNSIFAKYQKRSTAQWSHHWPYRIDFSGISWSQRQAGTAITPRHIVLAAHYLIKLNKEITFHDRTGAVHSRKIIKIVSFRKREDEARSDIAVALLDTPLPPSVKTYRLLPPRTDYEHTLPGAPVLVTEQGRRVFIHQVRRTTAKHISFQKNPDYPESLYKPLIKGDSGNPSFLLVGGEPVLIETHTGGGGGTGPFYSAPPLFKALTEAVAALDPEYQIQTVPLDPELAPPPPKKEAPAPIPPAARPAASRPATQTRNPPATPPNTGARVPRVRRVPTAKE